MTPQVLAGKIGVVFGVANKRSIAWAIAKAWSAAGARLIFNYQGERLKENVEELTGEFGEKTPLFPCDVSSDEQIKAFFESVRGQTDHLDLMLHSLAFAPKEALEGDFLSTTREAFRTAHDISAYSLVALAREAAPLMTNGGSILAMTYYGSEKVVPHYNVMGVAKASLEASTRYLAYDLGPKKIRVNCISAGPVNTLAARGISRVYSDVKALSGARAAKTQLRSGRAWAQPEFSSPATEPRPSPVRSSTSMAVTRSWGCDHSSSASRPLLLTTVWLHVSGTAGPNQQTQKCMRTCCATKFSRASPRETSPDTTARNCLFARTAMKWSSLPCCDSIPWRE